MGCIFTSAITVYNDNFKENSFIYLGFITRHSLSVCTFFLLLLDGHCKLGFLTPILVLTKDTASFMKTASGMSNFAPRK